IVSSDEVAHGKPPPDVFLEAAQRLDVPPDRTLVLEDSLNGLRAAKAAGMTAALVPNQSVPPAPDSADYADLVIDRLAALDPAAPPDEDAPAAPRGGACRPRGGRRVGRRPHPAGAMDRLDAPVPPRQERPD